MNFPQTVEELIHWDVSTGQDTYGQYTIITGFEGTGGCFWCGKELQGRRRFCGHRSGCWTLYQDHFFWGWARDKCIKEYDYRCANCSVKGSGLYMGEPMTNLRAHHIIPLEGEARVMSPYNLPWNLICLCHECHQLIYTVMRGDKELIAKPDMFDLALMRGQQVFMFNY